MISWIEVMVGANSQQEKTAFEAFLRRFMVVDITKPIASQAVALRNASKLKLADAIILATAMHRETLLITRDAKDFADSPHVRIPYVL
jgi:predicted nucleic acid-binding protein